MSITEKSIWEILNINKATVKAAFWKAAHKFKKQAFNRRNLRYLLYYGLTNFLILILFTLFQTYAATNPVISNSTGLDLKPVTSPPVNNLPLLVFAIAILPLSLLLEQLGFRMLPMWYIKDMLRLNSIVTSQGKDEHSQVTVYHSRARWWIYHHWAWIFIVVSAVWAAGFHQLNVVSAGLLGSLMYFAVQLVAGTMLAWIYLHRGLGAAWIVNLSWDWFIVFLSVVLQVV